MWGFVILAAMYRQIFSTIFTLANNLSGGTFKRILDRLLDSLIFKELISIVKFLTNPALNLIYANLDSLKNNESRISVLIFELSNKINLLETLFLGLEKSLISLNENQNISKAKINECNQKIQFFFNILLQISQLQKASIFSILSEINGMKQVNKLSLANQKQLEEDFQRLIKTNEQELQSIVMAFVPIRTELILLHDLIGTESRVNYEARTNFNENLLKIKEKSYTFTYNQNKLLEAFKVFSKLYQSLNRHVFGQHDQYSINQEAFNSVTQTINAIEIEETSVNTIPGLQTSNSESIFESTVQNLKTHLKLIFASLTMDFSTKIAIGVENIEKSIVYEKKN